MKKVIRLTESELTGIIKKVISEAEYTNRTGNLSNPEEFLPSAKPKAAPSPIVRTPKSTYDINYPDIPQPKTAPVAPKTIFGIGDRGSEVLEIQKLLVKLGYNVGKKGADGIFGPATEAAVKQFQSTHGIKVSGRVGPPTKGKLATVASAPKQTYDPTAEWNQDRREDGNVSTQIPSKPTLKPSTQISQADKGLEKAASRGPNLGQRLREKPVKGFQPTTKTPLKDFNDKVAKNRLY